jgi:hypothetical protein
MRLSLTFPYRDFTQVASRHQACLLVFHAETAQTVNWISRGREGISLPEKEPQMENSHRPYPPKFLRRRQEIHPGELNSRIMKWVL